MRGIFGLFIIELRKREMRHKLRKRIEEIKEHKDKLNRYINHLNKAYSNGKIKYEDYFDLYSSILKEKSLMGWNDYFDREIENYELELKNLEEKRDASHAFLILLLLVVFALGLYGYSEIGEEVRISGFSSKEVNELEIEMYELNSTEDNIIRDKKIFKEDLGG